MRSLTLISITLLVVVPVLAQDAETWSQADTPQLEVFLGEARTRLEPLTGSEDASNRRWAAAIERRIELLGHLIDTRNADGALPSLEDIEARARTAASSLALEREREAPSEVALADESELKAYEDEFAAARGQSDESRDQRELNTTRITQGGDERDALLARLQEAKRHATESPPSGEYDRYVSDSTGARGPVPHRARAFPGTGPPDLAAAAARPR